MKCPECDYYNRADAVRCRSCGALLPGRQAVAVKSPKREPIVRRKKAAPPSRHNAPVPRKNIADFARAGFIIRSFAMAFDILFVFMFDLALLLGAALLIDKTTGIVDLVLVSRGLDALRLLSPLLKAGLIIGIAVPPLYFIVMIALFGQTVGKMIMGIRVVRSDGMAISFPLSALRLVCYVPSGLLLFVGFLWILWDAERQGWHDMICDTIVIRL
jgi:uncharacterized RDD family membrane protein YckC